MAFVSLKPTASTAVYHCLNPIGPINFFSPVGPSCESVFKIVTILKPAHLFTPLSHEEPKQTYQLKLRLIECISQVGQIYTGFINTHLYCLFSFFLHFSTIAIQPLTWKKTTHLYCLPTTLNQSAVNQFFDLSSLINRHFFQSAYCRQSLQVQLPKSIIVERENSDATKLGRFSF